MFFVLLYALCALLRIMDGPGRLPTGREFEGIPLMQSADSYAWLAAAKKINLFTGTLLPEIIRIVHVAAGVDIGLIGFYLPLVIAPLVILPVFILAAWWRMPEAAVSAALMAGASFGFLSRTRIGWLDNDVLTLFFPVSLAVALIVWIEPLLRSYGNNGIERTIWTYGGAFLIGLIFRSYLLFYPNGELLGLAIISCALFIGIIKSQSNIVFDLLIGTVIILLAGNGSWFGFSCAASATCLLCIKPQFIANRNVQISGVVVAVVILLLCYSFVNFSGNWLKIIRYGKFASDSDLRNLPAVIKTVEEAQSTDLQTAVRSLAGNWALFVAGFVGFVYCTIKRPATLIFAPLLLLGLLCGKLGSRFGMYGGAALAIGLGFGLAWFLRSVGAKAPVRWMCQAIAAGVIIWTARTLTLTTSVTDWHITEEYARTFKEIKKISPPNSQIWTWWDWGYAAQYFSERMTFADGGRNSASYVVPLAKLHYTSSPLYAYQLMLFTAEQQKMTDRKTTSTAIAPQYANPFIKLLTQQDPVQAQGLLDAFNRKLLLSNRELPEQYLVVTWGNLNFLPVIRNFGSLNLVTGGALKGTFAGGGDLKVSIRNGVISHGGISFELAALDTVGRKNGKLARERTTWPGRKREYFALSNHMDGSFYPMDEASYHSLMVQMLIAEPETFEPYFKLVIDRAPHIRVYRLNKI